MGCQMAHTLGLLLIPGTADGMPDAMHLGIAGGNRKATALP